MSDLEMCRHFDPVGARLGCGLGHGRQAPADCPCAAYDAAGELTDAERTRCEIWTRVMGYHRPTHCFNAGKRSEHAERRLFREGQS